MASSRFWVCIFSIPPYLITPVENQCLTPPKVRNLYADGDVVVAIYKGAATTTDGKPNCDTYNWVMKLQNDRITQVLASLDMAAYMYIINHIPADK